MNELEKLQKQVNAVDRCQSNLESAKEELKRLDGRKLFYPTAREYSDAVKLAEENVTAAQDTLDAQIRMNAYANGGIMEGLSS